MKILKIGIHLWITITSVISFLSGWIMLAHAPKPDQSGSPATLGSASSLPTLEPLNPLPAFGSDDNRVQTSPFFSVEPSQRSQFRPAFRTGGS